jgi:hypothetical protein
MAHFWHGHNRDRVGSTKSPLERKSTLIGMEETIGWKCRRTAVNCATRGPCIQNFWPLACCNLDSLSTPPHPPRIMESDKENDDGFFGFSEDLVKSPSHKSAGISEVTFEGLLSPPLKLHEDLKEGCGGQLWPAGMVLAKYMLQHRRNELRGRSM